MQIALTRLSRLAERQWGVVARWQLERCGISAATISRWTASGRLHRIYPGVYAVGHGALCTEGRLLAAILYAGPGAALSHATATSWWELLPYLPTTFDVTSPRRRRSLDRVRVHHRTSVERVLHRGLPVTPVPRTLLDFASVAPLERVRKVVAQADFQRRIDLDALDRVMGVGRAGSAKLKRALSLHRPEYARTLSPAEDLLLDLCRRHRIRFPEVNVAIGPYTVDALWRDAQLIVEVDGGDGHSTRAQMERDRERDLYLRSAGYSVLRYTWRQVSAARRAVAADLRRALTGARGIRVGRGVEARVTQPRRHGHG
jgi:very-short-patch-repair endonuclease